MQQMKYILNDFFSRVTVKCLIHSETMYFSHRSESNLDVATAPVFDAGEIVEHLADATSLEVCK